MISSVGEKQPWVTHNVKLGFMEYEALNLNRTQIECRTFFILSLPDSI